jgi:hypothetical protein
MTAHGLKQAASSTFSNAAGIGFNSVSSGMLITPASIGTQYFPSEIEVISKPEHSSVPECATCPHSLTCMSGVMVEKYRLPTTRAEIKKVITLACIDEGQTGLIKASLYDIQEAAARENRKHDVSLSKFEAAYQDSKSTGTP